MIGIANKLMVPKTSKLEWNISNAVYSNSSKFVGRQYYNTFHFQFNDDGTILYVVNAALDDTYIDQWSLSTPWDISTASYTSINHWLYSNPYVPYGIAFNNNGSKIYIAGRFTSSFFQYTLSTPWDISTMNYDLKSYNFSDPAPDILSNISTGMFLSEDDSKIYILDATQKSIYYYTMSIPGDISTCTYSGKFSLSSFMNTPKNVTLNIFGDKLYTIDTENNKILQFTLNVNYDITTLTYDNIELITSHLDHLSTLVFNGDGTKLYISNSTTNTIYEYNLI